VKNHAETKQHSLSAESLTASDQFTKASRTEKHQSPHNHIVGGGQPTTPYMCKSLQSIIPLTTERCGQASRSAEFASKSRHFDVVVHNQHDQSPKLPTAIYEKTVDFQNHTDSTIFDAEDIEVPITTATIHQWNRIILQQQDLLQRQTRVTHQRRIISHQLVQATGKATTHAYHIEGGRFHIASELFPARSGGGNRSLEDGGRRAEGELSNNAYDEKRFLN